MLVLVLLSLALILLYLFKWYRDVVQPHDVARSGGEPNQGNDHQDGGENPTHGVLPSHGLHLVRAMVSSCGVSNHILLLDHVRDMDCIHGDMGQPRSEDHRCVQSTQDYNRDA